MNKKDKWLYIIQQKGTDIVKIGVSNYPESRLKILQIGNPNELELIHTNIDGSKENYLHRLFKRNRINGEWFKLTKGDLINIIINLKNNEIKIYESKDIKILTEELYLEKNKAKKGYVKIQGYLPKGKAIEVMSIIRNIQASQFAKGKPCSIGEAIEIAILYYAKNHYIEVNIQ